MNGSKDNSSKTAITSNEKPTKISARNEVSKAAIKILANEEHDKHKHSRKIEEVIGRVMEKNKMVRQQ